MSSSRWDIFCKVVDNFGDIGVCWRLARQLHAEHGVRVRLWVDDLASFQRICPAISLMPQPHDQQIVGGVAVRHWRADSAPSDVADVVIDAFGCGLPPAYQAAMTDPATVWVNLEYLSAEPWVTECHGLASQLPGCVVKRRFFFPGFLAGSGGLMREQGLLDRRDAFQADETRADALLAHMGVPATQALRVLLFCYDNPALPALIEAFRQSSRPIQLVVPEGRIAQAVANALGHDALGAGQHIAAGALSVHAIAFVPQESFDELLWSMDVNFVRGEDSFVRAQWAARPFVWHIYPQEDKAHLKKLDAFLDIYCAGLPQGAVRSSVRSLWHAWNEGPLTAPLWEAFVADLPSLREHGVKWAEHLATLPQLTDALVQFCAKPV